MKKILLAGVAALSLAGCATLESGSLTTTQIYVAANAFDAAEVTATQYLGLPLCGTGPTVCRTQAASAAVVAATRGGYKARQALVAACAASATSTACISDYSALTAAVSGLQTTFTAYGVQKGS